MRLRNCERESIGDLCQITTPTEIARFIVKWAIRKCDDIILDPCVGTGKLYFECIKRFKDLCAYTNPIENIYCVDIDPTIIKKLKNKLNNKYRGHYNIFCNDFLKMSPGIDAINFDNILPLVDAIVCNPPYARHQLLSQSYKEEIGNIIEKNTGIELSGRSSFYIYFLIHATQFVRKRGRMAFVLPSNLLFANYGMNVKEFLVDNFRIVGIILFPEGELLFQNILTTTCIVLLEKMKDNNNIVKFYKLISSLSSQNLYRLINDSDYILPESWGTLNEVKQNKLEAIANWYKYFNKEMKKNKELIPLKDIAKVKRGIATGANDFFTLNDEMVKKWGINYIFLKPILARAIYAPFFDFTEIDFQNLKNNDKNVWILSTDLQKEELHGTNILKYIEEGEKQRLHLRHLTSKRRIWYSLENRKPSPIIFTYMSRKRPRFIHNKAKIIVLNTFHLIYPKEEISKNKKKLKALLAYLNSNKSYELLKTIGRIYGGGLLKVEPRELENLPIIKLQNLEKNDVEKLANLYEELCISIKESDNNEVLNEINQIIETIEKKND